MAELLFDKTWTINRHSSRFSTSRTPDTETRRYERVGDGYRLTVAGTHNGKPYEWGYTLQYDGKPHPVHGRPDADAIIGYRINDHITVGFFKKNGTDAGPYSRHVADDGRSLRVLTAGRNEDGSPFFDVLHYDHR